MPDDAAIPTDPQEPRGQRRRATTAQKIYRLDLVAQAKWRGLTDRATLAEVLEVCEQLDRLDWLPKAYDHRTVWKDWQEVLGEHRTRQQILAAFHLTIAQHDLDLAMAKVRTELESATGAVVAPLANAMRGLVHEMTDLYALRTPLDINAEVKRRVQKRLEDEGLLDEVTMDEVWAEFSALLPEVKVS